MRDTQGQHSCFTGSYDEGCANTAKQLLTANLESRSTVHDTVNPEGTTVGSALEATPSGSEPPNPVDRFTESPCKRGLPKNATTYRASPPGKAAEALLLPTKRCAPPTCLWSSSSQPDGDDHPVVGTNLCASFVGASNESAESSSTDTYYAEASCAPDKELHAFSRRLQQALLHVKRHAEDGFLTAKASVYGRLVEQLNAERERELQRLEEARQEAEGARSLLHALRSSKEATEEKLSRMCIFLRRQRLRQQVRQEQQEALHRWKCFAVRRRHQRVQNNIVISVRERIRTWRVFIPWRVAALQTASARRQQTAARQAQVKMDNQLRLAEADKAREEQLVRDLRQQLQAETTLRLRLQENLRRIFLEGASAVCGGQHNSCKGTVSESVKLCPAAHASNSIGPHKLNPTVGCTSFCTKVTSKPESMTASWNIQKNCSHTTEKSPETVTAAIFHERTEGSAKGKVGTLQNRGSLVSGGCALMNRQRRTNTLKTRPFTSVGYRALHPTTTSGGPAADAAHPSLPSVVTEEPTQCPKVRSHQLQRCLSGSKSLEVIGQTVVPPLLRDLLPAVTRELPDTSPDLASKMDLSSCLEPLPPPCSRATWCHAGTLDGLHPQEWDSKGPGTCEWSDFGAGCAHHPLNPPKVRVDHSLSMHHRAVYPGIAQRLERSTQGASTTAHLADRASCGPRVDYLFVTAAETNLLSRPGNRGGIGWAADSRQRLKTCMVSETVRTNCNKSVQNHAVRCDKLAKGPLRSTVTYPGGVETNQRYSCGPVYHKLPRSQDRVGCRTGRMGSTTPHIDFVCPDIRPPLGSHAGRVQGKKGSSWTQSC